MTLISFLFIPWLLLGLIPAGYTFAYMQNNWPALKGTNIWADRTLAALMCILGPLGNIILLVLMISPTGGVFGTYSTAGVCKFGWKAPWSRG